MISAIIWILEFIVRRLDTRGRRQMEEANFWFTRAIAEFETSQKLFKAKDYEGFDLSVKRFNLLVERHRRAVNGYFERKGKPKL